MDPLAGSTPHEPTRPAAPRENLWRQPIIYWALTVSPLGAPTIVMLYVFLGLCNGVTGGGFHCSGPLSSYFESIGGILMISIILGVGVPWGALAITIFSFAVYSTLYALSRLARHRLPIPPLPRRSTAAVLGTTSVLTSIIIAALLARILFG